MLNLITVMARIQAGSVAILNVVGTVALMETTQMELILVELVQAGLILMGLAVVELVQVEQILMEQNLMEQIHMELVLVRINLMVTIHMELVLRELAHQGINLMGRNLMAYAHQGKIHMELVLRALVLQAPHLI